GSGQDTLSRAPSGQIFPSPPQALKTSVIARAILHLFALCSIMQNMPEREIAPMEETTYALPATPKQIAYARALALRNQTLLPWEVQQDRRSLSAWIEAQAKLK